MARTPPPARAGTLVAAGLADMAAAVRNARRSVAVATPFMTADVAAFLIRACDAGKTRERRLLTALNAPAVEAGYLDPDAVAEFIAAGFEVKSLRNLHAKLLVADDNWALVGSGNLTTAGSNGGNAELGVVLDPGQAKIAVKDFFDRWWNAAEPLDEPYMNALRSKWPRFPERHRRAGRGGIFSAPPGVDLGAFSRDKNGSGYWLKIQYGSEARTTAAHWRARRGSATATPFLQAAGTRCASRRIGSASISSSISRQVPGRHVRRSFVSLRPRCSTKVLSSGRRPKRTPRNMDG